MQQEVLLKRMQKLTADQILLINELEIDPARFVSVLYYGGFSISADTIHEQILAYYTDHNLPLLKEVQS